MSSTARDPMHDPIGGDILLGKSGRTTVTVDMMRDGIVYYRINGLDGALHVRAKLSVGAWREALAECGPTVLRRGDESEACAIVHGVAGMVRTVGT